CLCISCFPGRKMERYRNTVFCCYQLHLDTIKITLHTCRVTAPFLVPEHFTVYDSHVIAYRHWKGIDYILHFTSDVLKIGTYNLKQFIKKLPNLMKASIEPAFVQHFGDKPILLHELDGRGVVPVKARGRNNCGQDDLTVTYLSSNIFFVLNSL